jgi:hypothetical protein
MKLFISGRSMVGWALLSLAMMAFVPVSQSQSTTNLDKHARKIEKTLAKYPAGSYLHLVFRDDTESSGALGTLSETSFSFTNAETNAKETHRYSDVARAEKGKKYIGEGTAHRHQFHILWLHF